MSPAAGVGGRRHGDGGESGPGHRPEDKAWARDMRDACRAAGVAYYHKQSAGPRSGLGVELDGETIHELPETPFTRRATGQLRLLLSS